MAATVEVELLQFSTEQSAQEYFNNNINEKPELVRFENLLTAINRYPTLLEQTTLKQIEPLMNCLPDKPYYLSAKNYPATISRIFDKLIEFFAKKGIAVKKFAKDFIPQEYLQGLDDSQKLAKGYKKVGEVVATSTRDYVNIDKNKIKEPHKLGEWKLVCSFLTSKEVATVRVRYNLACLLADYATKAFDVDSQDIYSTDSFDAHDSKIFDPTKDNFIKENLAKILQNLIVHRIPDDGHFSDAPYYCKPWLPSTESINPWDIIKAWSCTPHSEADKAISARRKALIVLLSPQIKETLNKAVLNDELMGVDVFDSALIRGLLKNMSPEEFYHLFVVDIDYEKITLPPQQTAFSSLFFNTSPSTESNNSQAKVRAQFSKELIAEYLMESRHRKKAPIIYHLVKALILTRDDIEKILGDTLDIYPDMYGAAFFSKLRTLCEKYSGLESKCFPNIRCEDRDEIRNTLDKVGSF